MENTTYTSNINPYDNCIAPSLLSDLSATTPTTGTMSDTADKLASYNNSIVFFSTSFDPAPNTIDSTANAIDDDTWKQWLDFPQSP